MSAPQRLGYREMLDFAPPDTRIAYGAKDVILYALAVGAGADLPDAATVPFVYERHLNPLPSFYNILSWPTNRWLHEIGLDMTRLVHGGEAVEIFAPLAGSGEVITRSHIRRAFDRGVGRGLIVEAVAEVHDAGDERLLARSVSSLFAMGDGGMEGAPAAEPLPAHERPDRSADVTLDLPTRRDQAALYRLCGDMNPIHIDSDAARLLGLERPLLHGLCTLGMCVHGLARRFPGIVEGRIRGFETRFRAPVFPGETVTLDGWETDDGCHFEARVADRMALTGGAIRLSPDGERTRSSRRV